MGRDQPYADGGGLCCLDQARRCCQAAVNEASGGTDGVPDLMVKLSLGTMSGPPFQERCLAELRERVANKLSLRAKHCEADDGQVMRL